MSRVTEEIPVFIGKYDTFDISAPDLQLNGAPPLVATSFATFPVASGARVVNPGAAVTGQKIGNMITIHIEPTAALSTAVAAVATDFIYLLGAVPFGFRPGNSAARGVNIVVNGTEIAGCIFDIATNGDIRFTAAPGGGTTFTIGQPCAVVPSIDITYPTL